MTEGSSGRDHPSAGGWHQSTPKRATSTRGESNLFLQLSCLFTFRFICPVYKAKISVVAEREGREV